MILNEIFYEIVLLHDYIVRLFFETIIRDKYKRLNKPMYEYRGVYQKRNQGNHMLSNLFIKELYLIAKFLMKELIEIKMFINVLMNRQIQQKECDCYVCMTGTKIYKKLSHLKDTPYIYAKVYIQKTHPNLKIKKIRHKTIDISYLKTKSNTIYLFINKNNFISCCPVIANYDQPHRN